MSLTNKERKAARLVTEGRVAIDVVEYDDLERMRYVAGSVEGDSGSTYHVSVTPAAAHCECEWAVHHGGSRCSHTIALQLAAWYAQRKEPYG